MRRIAGSSALAALWLAVGACSGTVLDDDDEPNVDPTDAVFEADRLLEIDITMAAGDWDALRMQSRSLESIFGANCLDGPRDRPFTYFPADVIVDGELVESVGVRKKGFVGSLDEVKPSLKVKFNEYVPGQVWSGMKRLTLNNSKQDPSYVKQCLGYRLFDDVGVPSPRCNFAQVTINGNDLGLFVHVESIKKDFLARHFDDNLGNLYEGALSDFRTDWVNTFERKTNKLDLDRTDLDAITTALEAPDTDLVAAFEAVADLDAFLDMWAMEVLIAHWDGYAGNTNNFYLYFDPTSSLAYFIPWGIDGVFDAGGGTRAVLAHGIVARRLYLYSGTQAQYLQRLRSFAQNAWDVATLTSEIDRMETLITPVVDLAGTGGLAISIQSVRDFVTDRGIDVIADLDAGTPVWAEPLRGPPCFEDVGSIVAAFDTTWGSIFVDPFSGVATLTGTVESEVLAPTSTGSSAGTYLPPDEGPIDVIQIVGAQPSGDIIVVRVLAFSGATLMPGVNNLGFGSIFGAVYRFVPATGAELPIGFFETGTLTLTQIGTNDSDLVVGSLTADIVRSGL